MKTCSKCRVETPFADFKPEKRASDGLTSACRACNAALVKAWRDRNPDRARALVNRWHAANPERVKAAQRAYYAANREKILAKLRAEHEADPGTNVARVRNWRKANPHKFSAQGATRRGRRRGATVESVDFTDILARDAGKPCYLCGLPWDLALRSTTGPMAPEIDHIVALAAGGAHAPGNLAVAHRRCNVRKSARPWHECTVMLT